MQAIDIRRTGAVVSEFEKELRTLSALQERVQDVYRMLPRVMDNPQIRASLNNQVSGLEREKLGYRKLSAALTQINTQYSNVENRIATYAEEGSGIKFICVQIINPVLLKALR